MDSADDIETLKRFFRRKYANDVSGLKVLAEKLFTLIGPTGVTIIGSTFEGGSAQGVLNGPSVSQQLKAAEEVIAELDDDAPLGTPTEARVHFRG